jgi:hypothetical protein
VTSSAPTAATPTSTPPPLPYWAFGVTVVVYLGIIHVAGMALDHVGDHDDDLTTVEGVVRNRFTGTAVLVDQDPYVGSAAAILAYLIVGASPSSYAAVASNRRAPQRLPDPARSGGLDVPDLADALAHQSALPGLDDDATDGENHQEQGPAEAVRDGVGEVASAEVGGVQ